MSKKRKSEDKKQQVERTLMCASNALNFADGSSIGVAVKTCFTP